MAAAARKVDPLVASLRPAFAELSLDDDKLHEAVVWCRQNGADSLKELQGAGAEVTDELIESLRLKKVKAINLRKMLVAPSDAQAKAPGGSRGGGSDSAATAAAAAAARQRELEAIEKELEKSKAENARQKQQIENTPKSCACLVM